ncbi:hypothetical protein V8F33_001719 [Rhypophila sp. PSN 637]
MDPTTLYLIAVGGAVTIPLLTRVITSLCHWFGLRFQFILSRFRNSSPILLPRSWEISWQRLFLILGFIAGNSIALALPTEDSSLERRTAQAASVNLMLVLIGGRTNPLADLVQIPLHSYYFAHRWIGAVATAEALLHSILVLRRQGAFDARLTPGIMVCGHLLLLVLAYPWFTWRPWRYFSGIHFLLSLVTLAGWAWHVLLLRRQIGKVLAMISCAIWLGTQLYRLLRIFIWRGSRGTITNCRDVGEAIFLEFELTYSARIFPGCYFYVFFPEPSPFYNRIRGYPMMPVWGDQTEFFTGSVRNLAFLMMKEGNHGPSLACTARGLRNPSVRLEGPYGTDLNLSEFETVTLVAKGIGITGILPFILYLAGRKLHNDKSYDSKKELYQDKTTRIAVIWWLEHNNQEDLVKEQLQKLETEIDPENTCLTGCCIYPSQRNRNYSLFRGNSDKTENQYFQVVENGNFDLRDFSLEIQRSARRPGRSVVLACGDETFRGSIRSLTLQSSTPNRIISFAEIEYRPHFGERVQPDLPGLSAHISQGGRLTKRREDIEMQNREVN